MSMVLQSREVVGINGRASPPAAYVSPSAYLHPKHGFSSFCVVTEEEDEEKKGGVESEEESSSIGVAAGESSPSSSSSEEEEEKEEQSKLKQRDPLGSFDSLEESLPIKRGLSSHFAGKSKSFASLADVAGSSTVRELAKPENPFNKRRRILMASKASWPRRASWSSLLINSSSHFPSSSSSSPLHSLEESDEEEEEEEERGEGGGHPSPLLAPGRRICEKKTFRTPWSFSFTDLKHAHDLS